MVPLLKVGFSVIAVLSPLATARHNSSTQEPTVTVRNGTYTGIHSSSYDQDFFLGLPFAQPPLADLRFRKPQSLKTTWYGARNASAYSAACVGYGGDNIAYPSQSEDCLYLNIVRPSGDEHKNLPIGVWIHGGGYYMGSGIDQRYNLSRIVKRSIEIRKPFIGVSINYRGSAWGFLSGKEVLESGETNLGLRDQRMALQWINENIGAFGGDPGKVTIWGESAGAGSVGNHLLAFGGRDDKLFRAAIMESGSPTALMPLSPNQTAFDSLTQVSGCSNATDKIECLRRLPFDTLNQAINNTGLGTVWAPVLDGDFIQEKASVQLAEGKYVHVPMISGANSDEGTAFGPQGINTTEEFFDFLTTSPSGTIPVPVPSDFATKILDAYPDIPSQGIPGSPPLPPDFRPGPPEGVQFRRTSAYFGDAFFIAARRYTCRTWAKAGLDAFCYRFNTIPAGIPNIVGVTHFQEVAFVFDNTQGLGYENDPFAGKPESYFELADLMSASWASFIYDLDPNSWRRNGSRNGTGTPLWPRYQAADLREIVWDANVTGLAAVERDDYREEGMELIYSHFADVYGI